MSYAVGAAQNAARERADSGETSGTDAAPEVRQEIFDKEMERVIESGLVGDHEYEFINSFATARFSDGVLVRGSEEFFDTSTEAVEFARSDPSVSTVNGLTRFGANNSRIFAGATLSRKRLQLSPGIRGSRSVDFTPNENMRFVLLHEFQHGPPRIRAEYRANLEAYSLLDRFD